MITCSPLDDPYASNDPSRPRIDDVAMITPRSPLDIISGEWPNPGISAYSSFFYHHRYLAVCYPRESQRPFEPRSMCREDSRWRYAWIARSLSTDRWARILSSFLEGTRRRCKESHRRWASLDTQIWCPWKPPGLVPVHHLILAQKRKTNLTVSYGRPLNHILALCVTSTEPGK